MPELRFNCADDEGNAGKGKEIVMQLPAAFKDPTGELAKYLSQYSADQLTRAFADRVNSDSPTAKKNTRTIGTEESPGIALWTVEQLEKLLKSEFIAPKNKEFALEQAQIAHEALFKNLKQSIYSAWHGACAITSDNTTKGYKCWFLE